MQKPNSRVFWYIFIGLVVFVAAYFLTSPEKPKAAGKKSVKKTFADKGDDQFTDEDRHPPKFILVSAQLKDVFKPQVVRKESLTGESTPNAIPSEFAQGESGWLYTGTGEVDGVPQALFENRQSGEGAFVKQGEHWKKSVIEQITPNSITISGPTGTKTLLLVTADTPGQEPGTSAGVAPVTPPISGAIGGVGTIPGQGQAPPGGAALNPGQDQSAAAATADLNAQSQSGTGGGGRRRRNRGGGGGG